jgi:hypothetical protein
MLYTVRTFYPGVFAAVGVASAVSGLSNTYQSFLQTVRDKEFVVEMRLQNRE